MMQERLPNGASVNRMWSDSKTELLGLFQYIRDAEEFARLKLAEDAKHDLGGSRYIVACTYSGKVTVFAPPPPTSAVRQVEK